MVAPSRGGGRPSFGLVRPKRGERRGEQERERYVGMIDERENEWRGIYIIPSPR